MRKISYIVLGGSLALTVLFVLIWIAGFIFAPQGVGGLIHLLLVLAMFTSIGVVIGVILLIVSFLKK